jgi:Rab GDP dissociation inhibitor
MEENYDVVVLGTGLTECILSGLISVDGKKVLHMDRNDYYGGECASLNLLQAWTHFKENGQPPENLGKPRNYNIDLVPKFLMANGKLVKILLHTRVTRYLQFKSVDGSYVTKKNKVHKVPATEVEALGSKLMGLFEKGRFKDFLVYVVEFDPNDPSTFKGVDPNGPTSEMLKKYKLEKGTVDFLGHALALYKDETWLTKPCKETIERVKLYQESLYQHGKSPYLYPLYGLGDLPQAFARLSAIYGGTYMLNKPIDGFEFDSKGKITGVTSEGQTVKCSKVIADPSYFPDKVQQIGQIIRCICILDHPVPGTSNSESCQIILPQNQIGRQADIYISCVSFAHNVAPPGKYIVMISTTVETNDPRSEVRAALDILGPILHSFYSVQPVFVPKNDPNVDGIYISNSYDSTSHFESIAEDVIRIYQQFTGKSDVSNILEPAPDDDPNENQQSN